MKTPRFTVYAPPGVTPQIRDSRTPRTSAIPGEMGIVAVFPTLGAGYSTQQLPEEARRLARKVCRLLNGV